MNAFKLWTIITSVWFYLFLSVFMTTVHFQNGHLHQQKLLGWAQDTGCTLGCLGTDASCAQFWVGVGAECGSHFIYIICHLEQRTVVWKHSRQTMYLEWWWRWPSVSSVRQFTSLRNHGNLRNWKSQYLKVTALSLFALSLFPQHGASRWEARLHFVACFFLFFRLAGQGVPCACVVFCRSCMLCVIWRWVSWMLGPTSPWKTAMWNPLFPQNSSHRQTRWAVPHIEVCDQS